MITISCPIGPVVPGTSCTVTGTVDDCSKLQSVKAASQGVSLGVKKGCEDGSWWASCTVPECHETSANIIEWTATHSDGTEVVCDVAIACP